MVASERAELLNRLNTLKTEIEDPDSMIHLSGLFKLTKTDRAWVDAVAFRDRALEDDVHQWIESRSSYEKILDRYASYDPGLHTRERPKHYPLRVISGVGSVRSGKNIFMFFPNALGLKPRTEDDVFGLEFIDVWSNLFRSSVFSCIQRTFAIEDQIRILLPLEANLERTIYLSSIFHEVGHRVGPYRVSPTSFEGLNLSEFQVDVFGELATDSLLILHLREFPEVALFILMQRLFWFGRRGYIDNPLSANLNCDNDAWIGAFLWNRLKGGAIRIENGQLRLNFAQVHEAFTSIVSEIDELARRTLDSRDQQKLVNQWMQSQVPCRNGRFFLPEDLRAVFSKCQDVPEVPHFQPMFSLTLPVQGAV